MLNKSQAEIQADMKERLEEYKNDIGLVQ